LAGMSYECSSWPRPDPDDESHIRELLRDFLTGEGYAVVAVATGAEALAAVPTVQPDVILLDMLMPGLSGRDVFDALRLAGVTVPVILISGTPRFVEEGFFRVLRKPFNIRTLAEVVAAAVNHRRSSSA